MERMPPYRRPPQRKPSPAGTAALVAVFLIGLLIMFVYIDERSSNTRREIRECVARGGVPIVTEGNMGVLKYHGCTVD